MTEVIRLTIALVLVVAQFVTRLQMSTLPERFTVGCIHHVATIVGRCGVVAGREIGGVLSGLVLDTEEVYFVVRDILLLVIACTSLETDGDVTALRVQAAEELQHTPGVLVLAIREAGLSVVVDGQLIGIHYRDSVIGKGIGDIEIRIVGEGGRKRGLRTVARAVTAVGTQQDSGQRVWFPLETNVTIPVIVTRETPRVTVGEGAVGLAVKVLAGILIGVVTVAVVPADIQVGLHLVAIVIVEVRAEHLTSIQTTTVPPACVLLLVVQVAYQHDTSLVRKTTCHAT